MSVTKKAAEILVECGYAFSIDGKGYIYLSSDNGKMQKVSPFSDTIEGRRQADAIEDWLNNKQPCLWQSIGLKDAELYMKDGYVTSAHKWRLDRIRWCLEQLEEI